MLVNVTFKYDIPFDRVKVLCPSRHWRSHFVDILPSQSLCLDWKKN